VSRVPSVIDQDLVDLPVLLVSGQQHPFIWAPDDGALAGLDYNVYADTFEDAQHYPMLDETNRFNPKDEWKRRIR
jgi:pimeloyl-ACP methyl ester carboxylesterase